MFGWWFRDPRDCGFFVGGILYGVHWGVHLCITFPSLILFLLGLIVLLPVRGLEGWAQRRFGVRWEQMFIFHYVSVSARFLILLMGLRVEVSGAEALEGMARAETSGEQRRQMEDSHNNHSHNHSHSHSHNNNDSAGEWRGCVLVFNHYSLLDGILLTGHCPLAHSYVAKAELLWYPLVNIGMWVMGHFFVDRGNRQQATEALHQAAELLRRRRRCIAISPEGTRSHDGRLGAFKKGPFHLAGAAGVPIVPCAIHGAFRSWPRHSWAPHPGHIRIVFGRPIPAPAPHAVLATVPPPLLQRLAPRSLAALAASALARTPAAPDISDASDALRLVPDKALHALARDCWAMAVWDALRSMLLETQPDGLANRPSWSHHEPHDAHTHAHAHAHTHIHVLPTDAPSALASDSPCHEAVRSLPSLSPEQSHQQTQPLPHQVLE